MIMIGITKQSDWTKHTKNEKEKKLNKLVVYVKETIFDENLRKKNLDS